MKKYFEHLRPMERRLAVGVIVVVLLVVNYWYIWPHFSDWGDAQGKTREAEQTLKTYQDTIAQKYVYEKKLKEIASEGADVAAQDESVNLMRAVQKQSAYTGVIIQSSSRAMAHTNSIFFIEQVQNVNVVATDGQLVDFLYQLANDPAMIRVRDLELEPDGARQHLNANMQLVASYQKNPGPRNTTISKK